MTTVSVSRLTQPPVLLARAAIPVDGWLQGLKNIAATQGGRGVAAKLAEQGSRGPLAALLSTPQGRAALANAVISFQVGYEFGKKNGPELWAVLSALQVISDKKLSPQETARQVAQVLTAGWKPLPQTKPATDPGIGRRTQSLTTSLNEAKQALSETKELINKMTTQGQDTTDITNEILKPQQQRVDALQRQLDQLRPPPSVTTPRQPPVTRPRPPETKPLPPSVRNDRPANPGVDGQRAQQTRIEKNDFQARLSESAGTAARLNPGLLNELVQTKSPDELRALLSRIKTTLAGGEGGFHSYGNIYKDVVFPDGSRPAQAKSRDFEQFSTPFGLLLGRDLKFLASGLETSLKKQPAQALGNPAATHVNGGVSSPGQKLQPQERKDFQAISDALGQMISDYKAADMGWAPAPGGENGAAVKTTLVELTQLRAGIESALSSDTRPAGQMGINLGRMLGMMRGGAQRAMQALEDFLFQPATPGAPGTPPPRRPINWDNIFKALLAAGVATAVGVGIANVGEFKDQVKQPMDLKYQPFDVETKIKEMGSDLGDSAKVAQLQSQIMVHYLNQAGEKIKAENKGRDQRLDKVHNSDTIARILSFVRTTLNKDTNDTTLTPVSAVQGVLASVGWSSDSRAQAYVTNAIARANADIAAVNNAVSTHWSSVRFAVNNKSPRDDLNDALRKAGVTKEEYEQLVTGDSGPERTRLAAKAKVTATVLTTRIDNLTAEVDSLKAKYTKATGLQASTAQFVSTAKTLLGSLTPEVRDSDAGKALATGLAVMEPTANVPNAIASLIQTKEAEIVALQNTRTTLNNSFLQSQQPYSPNTGAGQQLRAQRIQNTVLAPLQARRQELAGQLDAARQSLTIASADITAQKEMLAALSRRITKYEQAPKEAEAALRSVTLPDGVALTLEGGVERDAEGRFVVSKSDQAELKANLERYRGLLQEGAITQVEYQQVASAMSRYVDTNGNRVPLIPYPRLGLPRGSQIDTDALTVEEYKEAVKQREVIEAAIRNQPAEVARIKNTVEGLQGLIGQLDRQIVDETTRLQEAYKEVQPTR